MNDITGLLIALAFVFIGIVFLISYFITRAKVIKRIGKAFEGQSTDSIKDSKLIIENIKKLVWHLGIAYVTIALSLFFEGLSGVITSAPIVITFVILGVILFIYGVVLTAYGVLALYNEKEQKFGKMEKATLVSICKLQDGKQLLVFVPDGSFGGTTLNNIEMLTQEKLNTYKSAGGNSLDCCVVDDASKFSVDTQYLLYVSALRVKYNSVNISFITANGVEASINAEKPADKTEKVAIKAAKPAVKKEQPKAAKTQKAAKQTETKKTK